MKAPKLYTRLIATLLLATYLPACTSYQAMAAPTVELQAPPKPVQEARLTLASGERFELRAPRVNGDSLRGLGMNGKPRSVALADVTKVEVQKPNTAGTVGVIVGGLVVGGLIVGGILLSNADFGCCGSY